MSIPVNSLCVECLFRKRLQMARNIGSEEKVRHGTLGFGVSEGKTKFAEHSEKMRALREHFRPELINRIDEIIVFEKLSREDVARIASMMLAEGEARIEALGVHATFDESVSKMLAACEDVETYGARPLRREISSKIEDAVSLWLLDGKICGGEHVRIFYDRELQFEKMDEK